MTKSLLHTNAAPGRSLSNQRQELRHQLWSLFLTQPQMHGHTVEEIPTKNKIKFVAMLLLT